MGALRKVRRFVKKRVVKHRATVRQAKAQARKTATAQKQIATSSRMTAADLVGSGDWMWAGDGMSPDTVMEAVWTKDGWEYVPAARQPRKAALANDPSSAAKQCRGKTKDGTACERIGKCPIKSHARNKV